MSDLDSGSVGFLQEGRKLRSEKRRGKKEREEEGRTTFDPANHPSKLELSMFVPCWKRVGESAFTSDRKESSRRLTSINFLLLASLAFSSRGVYPQATATM